MSEERKPHPLVDVEGPNLVEETFPHELPPLVRLEGPVVEYIDGRPVEFDPASVRERDIVITDTTFRDGQQARPPYTIDQMVRIYDLMAKLGGPNRVIRQTEFFLYTKNDRETLDRCRALGHEAPECTGWIRAVKGDFRLVKEAGLKESGMLTSCSDYHIFHKLKMDRRLAMDRYCEVVDGALAAGVRPRCHLEDITRADIDGFVLPFVDRLMEMSEQVPDELKVKIRLCDTMGFGLPYPGAKLPRSVPKLIYKLNRECGVPSDRLEWHGHNDFHKVHVNGATAWLYGCDAVNATLFGFGERTGNPPLEGAILEYIALKGDLCGIDTPVITELADYMMRSIGLPIPDNYPFVGKHFNTTRAGIHAGGLRQDERIYNIFDTETLLGKRPHVAITDKSGADGVAVWVNELFALKGDDRINKIKVHRLARWVLDQYEVEGRLTAISDEEMEAKTKELMPDYWARHRGSTDR